MWYAGSNIATKLFFSFSKYSNGQWKASYPILWSFSLASLEEATTND